MKNKVIQFGEGNFLRGFVDWIIQILNENSDFDAAVTVVQPIEKGLCDLLDEQNGAYTHIMRGLKDGSPVVDTKFIDVIRKTVQPYRDFDAFLSLAEEKDYRFIVSNTTESGIEFVKTDRMENAPAISFPAKLTLLLKRRFELALPGFIFLPCELIDQNGKNLKKCVLDYAALWNLSEEFCEWVEKENIFCNTLVDRIVTGYPKDEENQLKKTDKLLNTSELFHLWVIEGPQKILEEIPFDQTDLNVIVTDELEKYRTRKVRILNGAHTSMIPFALLSGVETVKDCMENPMLSAFLEKCVFEEIIPTLDLPKEELVSYAKDVFERFRNPFIRHFCASISLNSISKFKVRVLPSLLEFKKRFDRNPENLLFSLAKLISFYQNGTPSDDEAIIAFIKNHSVEEILANENFWGEDLSFLAEEVKKYVNAENPPA